MSKASVLILMLVAVVMTTQVCAFNRTVVQNALSQLTDEDKAVYIADFLINHKTLFDKLLKIMVSGSDLVPGGDSNSQSPEVMPFILDRIPDLLDSQLFRYILYVASDEFARIDVSDKLPHGAPANVSDDLAKLYLSRFNYPRFIKRVLAVRSARALFPLTPNATVHPQCYSDSMDFIDAVVGARPPHNETYFYVFDWALRMLDSFGKPSGGIEKGALYYVGSFDECMSVKAHLPKDVVLGGTFRDHEVDFGTRFCRVKYSLPPSIVQSLAAGVDTKGVPLALHWGICVPDSCHSSDVDGIFHLGYAGLANLSLQVTCYEDNDLSTDASAITAIAVLSVLAAIAVLCTVVHGLHEFYHAHFAKETLRVTDHGHINSAYVHVEADSSHGNANSKGSVMETKLNGGPYDCIEQSPPQSNGDYATLSAETAGTAEKAEKAESMAAPVEKVKPAEGKAKKKPKLHPIITSFSLYANLPKIFNASKNPQALHCVHGIRFFSLLWIVLGHTYNYGVLSVVDNPTTINLIDASELLQRFTFQGIMAAGFAVDTFFLLSSMLVTWLFLKDLQKKKLSVGYFIVYYVHRIWRLTPLYMLVLMTFTCLYRYLGTGPLWPETVDTADNCRMNWWTNLLYVNNLVNVDKQCMGWTWYLADDMQLYIISPIFIIALWKKQVLGIILCVLMMLGGMASAIYKEYIYGGDLFSMHENSNYWKEVYIPPWCKVAAWMVGMLLGYAIHKYKGIRMKSKVVALGWAVTWAVGLCLCYVTYTFRKAGGHPWSPAGSAVFEGLGRPLWAACLAWIIFACHNGRGGIINSILSWSGLIPLSRLTYAAYLIHPIMMVLYVFSKRSLLYLNDFDMAYLYIGHTVMTFLLSTLFSALFEAPMLGLEKLVLTRH